MKKTQELKTFLKICIEIETKEDEVKWKEFLKHYFPNHYAKGLLNNDLVVDVETKYGAKGHENKYIAVSTNGYGYISLRFACEGGYKEVFNFEEFKSTACYKAIVAQGVTLEVGRPNVIVLKR